MEQLHADRHAHHEAGYEPGAARQEIFPGLHASGSIGAIPGEAPLPKVMLRPPCRSAHARHPRQGQRSIHERNVPGGSPMTPFRFLALVALAVLALIAGLRLTDAEEKKKARAPVAIAAENAFFGNFNGGGPDRSAALRLLMAAYATDPKDARTNLLLGLNHLWI